MPQNIFSTNFLNHQGLEGVDTYTVPLGFTAVLRWLSAFCHVDLFTAAVHLSVKKGSTITLVHLTWQTTDQKDFQIELRQPFSEGESFSVVCDDGAVDYMLSGYLFANQS